MDERRTHAMTIDERLKAAYPQARIVLEFSSYFQLLVSVMLSAQTTDITVNKVTKRLFARFPTAETMAEADLDELEELVRPTGFFHNKARNVLAASRMIVAEFGGKVPDTMEALTSLPGVARKTANIVLFNAYGRNDGIAVDTHVKRLSQRLGLSAESDPVKIERDLMALFPREEWGTLTYRLIDHGRAVCDAKRPICGRCVLSDVCPSAFAVKGWRQTA